MAFYPSHMLRACLSPIRLDPRCLRKIIHLPSSNVLTALDPVNSVCCTSVMTVESLILKGHQLPANYQCGRTRENVTQLENVPWILKPPFNVFKEHLERNCHLDLYYGYSIKAYRCTLNSHNPRKASVKIGSLNRFFI